MHKYCEFLFEKLVLLFNADMKGLRNIEIIRKKHEMAVAKQQSEAWRKALDGVPDSLRMLLEINNTENVPEYSEKQKKAI